MAANYLRIVPSPDGPNALGTRVFCGEEEISVTSIELTANVETKRWEVRITTHAVIDGEITAEIVGG